MTRGVAGVTAERLRRAHARSEEVARRWRDSAPMRDLAARFDGLGAGDLAEIAHRAHELLEDADWAAALIAPLVDALRGSLDAEGRATSGTVAAVADLTAALAQGVRAARQAAE